MYACTSFKVFAVLSMTCGSYSNTRVHVYMTGLLLFYCHSAGGGRGLWYIPDLRDGLDLVHTLDPYDESAVKMTPCKCSQYTSCHYAMYRCTALRVYTSVLSNELI